jgi:ABC-type polysaccharide/polyol phosphate export permease
MSMAKAVMAPDRARPKAISNRRRGVEKAWDDIWGGLLQWQLWVMLAWSDTRQRYSRTVLGPFWMTLSVGLFIGTMGFLYAQIYNMKVEDYLPYLAAGYISWLFFAAVITESCSVFFMNKSVIEVRKLPYSMFVYRTIIRNLIGYAHNMVVYVIVAFWFAINPGWYGLLLIPALILISLTGLWVGLLLGLVCTRFRDMPQLVSNLLTIMFFLTPVFWLPNMSGNRLMLFANVNILYHYVSILRQPLLGRAPDMLSWYAVTGTTVLGMIVSTLLYGRFRARIPYWL